MFLSKSSLQATVAGVQRNALVATTVWYVWWERRRYTHEEFLQDPSRSAQAIAALAKNFTRARNKNTKIRRHGWERPPEGIIKLNVDAGFEMDSGSGSTGAILRDDMGNFLAASSGDIPFVVDAATAEARALRNGLLLANDMGCNNFMSKRTAWR